MLMHGSNPPKKATDYTDQTNQPKQKKMRSADVSL